jgi:hypothetical protein
VDRYETVAGPRVGMRSICSSGEWSSLNAREPGQHQIVKSGILDETEAEKIARGTSGDVPPRQTRDRPKFT